MVRSGGPGFDERSRLVCQADEVGAYLHLELKDASVLENPTGEKVCPYDTGLDLCWGYTPGHPTRYGYRDPLSYSIPGAAIRPAATPHGQGRRGLRDRRGGWRRTPGTQFAEA